MVMGSSSQQQGLEQDDQTGYRPGQNLDVAGTPPPNVIRLWQDVALGIDRSQTGKRSRVSSEQPAEARRCLLNSLKFNAQVMS